MKKVVEGRRLVLLVFQRRKQLCLGRELKDSVVD